MSASAAVWSNGEFSLGGNELGTYVTSVSLTIGREAVDGSAMGDVFVHNFGGLATWALEVELNSHSTAVDAIIAPLVGVTSGVAWTLRQTTEATSTSNCEYSGTCIISGYTPFQGAVGEMRMASLSLTANSALTRATA